MQTSAAEAMPSEIDLTNCDREQIQFSGAIEPHAAMLVLKEPELQILQVSANSQSYLGIAPEALLGQGIEVLLGHDATEALRARLGSQDLSQRLMRLMAVTTTATTQGFHLLANRVDDLLLIELERIDEQARAGLPELYQEIHASFQDLRTAPTLRAFFDLAVAHIRTITGFDRVLAYRFAPDGSGEVIAESALDGLETYLGLHYPAADIPEPARRLFALSWVRHLPDVDYRPVPLVPVANPLTGGPVDLSYIASRSVSTMYTDYLRNMGVKATLVTTLFKDGQLWGLVSCMNHETPKYLPYETRMAVECFAHTVSLLVGTKEAQEQHDYQLKLNESRDQILSALLKGSGIHETLIEKRPALMGVVVADGFALLSAGRLSLMGHTPPEPEIRALMDWLAAQEETDFASDRLPEVYPPAAAFRETASGVLAVRFALDEPDGLLWLRREWRQTVDWAGNPHKPVEIDETDPESRLKPRASFALWRETVAGQSRQWLDCEIAHAKALRGGIVDMLVSHTSQLRRVNTELAASNLELDTFAYAASHDLKEPLRSIHNSVQFLQEDEGDSLSDQGRQRLSTILRLARRMDDLLESLLYFSRVGRLDLAIQTVDLNNVVSQSVEGLRPLLQEAGAQIDMLGDLPTLACDPVRATEIFTNLITNAVKYNDKPERRIVIGCECERRPPVLFVRDNGIGIAARHFGRIFHVFRRLHGQDEYGGGTGAGLTITKKAIERHGGEIWLESVPGQGTTFFFTLAPRAMD